MGIILIKKLKLLGLLISQLLNPNSQFFGQNQNRPQQGIFQNQNQNGPMQDPYPVNPDFEPLFPPLDFFVNVSTTTTTTLPPQYPRPTGTGTGTRPTGTRPTATATPPPFPTTAKTTTEIIFITSKPPSTTSQIIPDEQLIDEMVIMPDLNPTNRPGIEDTTQQQQQQQDASEIDPENLIVDPETGRKFEKNTKGPCGDNMIFFANPVNKTSKYGVCDCEDQMSKEPARPLLFLFGQEKCFPFFTQGPCSSTHWLVLNDQNLPVCKKNPCLNLNNDESAAGDLDGGFYFARGNSSECLKTKTKGDCQDGQVLGSISSSWLPTCVDSDQENDTTSSSSSNSSNEDFKCRPGSRLYRMNLCY